MVELALLVARELVELCQDDHRAANRPLFGGWAGIPAVRGAAPQPRLLPKELVRCAMLCVNDRMEGVIGYCEGRGIRGGVCFVAEGRTLCTSRSLKMDIRIDQTSLRHIIYSEEQVRHASLNYNL